jgi:hypothetical protein
MKDEAMAHNSAPQGPASAAPAAEPLDAILADYRADIPAMTSGELPHPTPEYLRILLDRIEAAVERERAPGNASAMREALEDSLRFWNGISSRTRREENLRLEIAAALAAPARNCDKYSLDDIKKMDRDFGAFCKQFGAKNGENCSGCPIKPMDNLCCHSTWMLLPAAEGGAE